MKTSLFSRARFVRSAAFTLLELLVVIGVLALLASTLATTVTTTKPGAYTYQCRNNLRQLGFAWKMYADDNSGGLASNRDGASAGKSRLNASWSGGWLNYGDSTDNTNAGLLVDHKLYPYGAALGPYVKRASVFKCPADYSFVTINRKEVPRVRSISMNNSLGFNCRLWSSPSRFTLYNKFDQIRSPGRIFVFAEEREDSINDPVFFTNPDTPYNLIDFPASYHAGAGNLSFADGHVETHRWMDSRTIPPLVPGKYLMLYVVLPGNPDVTWLQEHASEPR